MPAKGQHNNKKAKSRITPKNSLFEGYEVEHNFPHIGKKKMNLNACRIMLKSEKTESILLTIENITKTQ